MHPAFSQVPFPPSFVFRVRRLLFPTSVLVLIPLRVLGDELRHPVCRNPKRK